MSKEGTANRFEVASDTTLYTLTRDTKEAQRIEPRKLIAVQLAE